VKVATTSKRMSFAAIVDGPAGTLAGGYVPGGRILATAPWTSGWRAPDQRGRCSHFLCPAGSNILIGRIPMSR